jgi:hypothetical protein
MKQRKTPQEKKRLSYERDRRNRYGESPHAARKGIPLRRALRSRANRHYQDQALRQLAGREPDGEAAEAAESRLRHRVPNRWRKDRDSPLGEVVSEKLGLREAMRAGGGRRAVRTVWVWGEDGKLVRVG